MENSKYLKVFFVLAVFLLTLPNISKAADKKKYDFVEAMKFHVIKRYDLSKDGKWVAYNTAPDRGDPKGYVKSTVNDSTYEIKCGINPKFNNNSTWVGFIVKPEELKKLNAKKDKPKNSLALVRLEDGERTDFEKVKSFTFSEDSRWAAIWQYPGKENKKTGSSDLLLRDLNNETQLTLNNVADFAFDSLSNYFAYIVDDPEEKDNGVYIIRLKGAFALPMKIEGKEKGAFSSLEWSTKTDELAYISCVESSTAADSCSLMIWQGKNDSLLTAVPVDGAPEGWYIPEDNNLAWTEDQNRLFFGFKPFSDTIPKKEKVKFTDSTYYDISTILKKIDVDIWHWKDGRIKTNERIWWNANKNRTFAAVYFTDSKHYVQLSDLSCPDVDYVDNPSFTVGHDNTPYLKLMTWEGFFYDVYAVNVKLGTKKLIAEKVAEPAHISPQGKFIAYFKYPHWYLYDTEKDTTENLTARIETPFYNEDNDVPAKPESYGIAGWLDNDNGVIINDKYDIWIFYANGGFMNQTAREGRDNKIIFRMRNLDRKKKSFNRADNVFMSGFSEKTKKTGIFRLSFETIGPELIKFDDMKYRLLRQSEDKQTVMYSAESFDVVPDLWVGDSTARKGKKITDLNAQLGQYNWGSAELIHWQNFEGDTMDGIIYKPHNYDPNKRYPVLIWFYERFSQRLYDFNRPYLGHRPCYQIYNDDDYIVFLPDVKFKVGYPGYSSVSCIVSGVKYLIDKGIADSSAVGITGHSWSGYQAAFLVTQTDIFAAAVAGAPVSNMTSAYSGIRLGSGLARQFQYEMGQSRIGGNLWDSLDAYLRNSPVMQAQKTNTPLMIMFGNRDWAVPWQQGEELYLAWRRLNKNCIFLEYFDEPHWPEKFFNRLDYAIKMKDFFDTYCLKKPAPEWILKGQRYKGTRAGD